MSETPRIEHALEVRPERIKARLRQIERDLSGVARDIEANQREYDELIERNHILVSEHDALRRRLDYGREVCVS